MQIYDLAVSQDVLKRGLAVPACSPPWLLSYRALSMLLTSVSYPIIPGIRSLRLSKGIFFVLCIYFLPERTHLAHHSAAVLVLIYSSTVRKVAHFL